MSQPDTEHTFGAVNMHICGANYVWRFVFHVLDVNIRQEPQYIGIGGRGAVANSCNITRHIELCRPPAATHIHSPLTPPTTIRNTVHILIGNAPRHEHASCVCVCRIQIDCIHYADYLAGDAYRMFVRCWSLSHRSKASGNRSGDPVPRCA